MTSIESSSPVKETAQALGHLVMVYSGLERTVSSILGTLLKLSFPAGHAVLGNIELPKAITIIRAYGFTRRPNEDWYARLEKVMNHVENDLRPERNRMIHATWAVAGTDMIRVSPRVKVIRPQAGEPRELSKDQPSISVSDINTLTVKVIEAEIEIHRLMFDYQHDATPYKWPG